MHYAANLNLRDKCCIVVGGGPVGARKVRKLLDADAAIEVISPAIVPQLAEWAQHGRIKHHHRPYQDGDLARATLVFAATNDRAVNAAVAAEARRRGIPVNIADDPAACDFIVPAVLTHGQLQMAFSTNGTAPQQAKALRDALAADLRDGGRRFYTLLQTAEND